MIRLGARRTGTPIPPSYGFAISSASDTPYVTSSPIITAAWTVRKFFQTPGKNTISAWLDVCPPDPPDVLTFKVPGGLNGITRGIHPADGIAWSVDWSDTNPFVCELLASQWVVESVFYEGFAICYEPDTLFDAVGELQAMAAWVYDQGAPCEVQMPLGSIYHRADVVFWPGNVKVMGHGDRRTVCWMADAYDQPTYGTNAHIWGTGEGTTTVYGNVSNTTWEDIWFLGARQHGKYGSGQHLISVGSRTNTDVPISLIIRRCGIIGSAGYGGEWGADNYKYLCRLEQCIMAFTDSDGWDEKNRQNTNVAGVYEKCRIFFHALNTQGTALQPVITTDITIPITVTSGSKVFKVSQTVDPGLVVGDSVTVGAPTFHGLQLSGQHTITSTAGGLYSFNGSGLSSGNDTSSGVGVTWISRQLRVITTAAIAITTTNGSSQFTVLRTTDLATQPGEIATMSGAAFHGLEPTGSFRVIRIGSGGGAVMTLDTLEDFTMPPDAITPTLAGSAACLLNLPGHGRAGTTKMQFTGATNGGGCTINPATVYTGTIVDASTISVTLGGSATNPLTAFGGANASVELWTEATSRRTVTLGSDPFSVISSNTTATVHDVGHGAAANAYVTFSGATGGFAGLLAADLNKQFQIISITDANNYTITLTATPNATIAGGGASVSADYNINTSAGTGMTWCCPHISDGDVPADRRGHFNTITDCYWEGELFGRNGFRGRGGTAQNNAGLGAQYMVFNSLRGRDLTPAWVKDTGNSGNFLQLLSEGMIATDIVLETSGGASLCVTGADSDGCIVNGFYIDGGVIGADMRGDRSQLLNGTIKNYGGSTNTDLVRCAISMDGQTTSDDQFLTADPFTAAVVSGSSPTTTNVFAEAHGKAGPTFTVQFAGTHGGDGLIVIGSNQPDSTYTATVVDANNYTVNLAGSAITGAAFGGDSVRAIYGSIAHIAKNIKVDNVILHRTAARADSGVVEILMSSHTTKPQVSGTHYTTDVVDPAIISDNSLNDSAVWGPGNVDLPNLNFPIDLPADGSGYTLTWADSGKTLINPTNAAAQNVVTLPDNTNPAAYPRGFHIRAIARNTTGANGIKFTSTAGTINEANNASSNPGSYASSTAGAVVEIESASSPGFRAWPKVGTWTLS